MITCTRRIQFCSGHFVDGHENKCASPHGHNYVAFIEAAAGELDDIGRVIDFSVLKARIGGWIDEHWDHGFIVPAEMSGSYKPFLAALQHLGSKFYQLPENPTAENMARHLYTRVCPMLLQGTGVEVTRVTLWETENCYATVGDE